MRTSRLLTLIALLTACGGSDRTSEPAATAAFATTSADTLYEQGMSAWLAGDAVVAEERLRASLAANPRYLAAHVSLGQLMIERENAPAALESFDRAVALRPQAADAQTGRARALLALGRLDEAADAAATAVSLGASSGSRGLEARAHEVAGDVARARDQRDLAMASYERALEVDATHVAARLHLAEIYSESERVGDAVALLARGVSDDLAADTMTEIGALLHRFAAYDRAAEILTMSDRDRPGDARTLYLLASAHVRTGNTEAGLERASQALAADPEMVESYVVRGEANLSRGFIDNADEDADAVLARVPNHYDALVLSGDIAFTRLRAASATDYTSAISRYLQALQVDPVSVRARDHLARLYRDRAMWPEAVALLESSMDRDDAPADWTAIMVAALRGSGRDRDALPYQSVLATQRRDDPTLHFEAASAGLRYPGVLSSEAILDHARRAVEFSGGAPLEYRVSLIDALLLNGRTTEAAEVLAGALRLFPSAPELQQRRARVR